MVTADTANPFNPAPASTPAANLRAIAIFSWKGRKENQLSFAKNDIIAVRKQGDSWWAGELNGQVGWFPRSYVRLIRNESQTLAPSTPATAGPSTPSTTASSASVAKPFKAIFAYEGIEKGELSFEAGDIISVTKDTGDWWEGECNGATGSFPKKYVRPC
jgi:hypothetical protein